MSGIWGVVPVKCFGRGKSRLADVLSAPAREVLARELCEHVLAVLAGCPGIGGTLVVTDCAGVEELARARGVNVIRDPSEGRLAQIADHALATLASRGARGALVLMSDLPLLEPSDVAALVAGLDQAPVVLAPDLRDAGTNALGLAPPDGMRTCFGSETSFDLHLARAREASLPVFIHRSEGTGRDLDSPEDLGALAAYGERGARLSWKRNRSSRVRAA